MNIHEYQAKAILQTFGIQVPESCMFEQSTLSLTSIEKFGKSPLVVKAQVHAGGRGKAGGIKIVKTAQEAYDAAKSLLGSMLKTYQTGGTAKPVERILIEPAGRIAKELYLAVALDREAALPCVICSEAGGVDIETVARRTPEKVLKFHFDPDGDLAPGFFRPFVEKFLRVAKGLDRVGSEMTDLISKLAKAFVSLDASLIEINPLGYMADGTLVPIDAKINFDDNALFRHPEITQLHDPHQEDSREVEAKQFDLSYVGLDGNIGCMVNGAGLAMATMDIIQLGGGEPANFLDVGGGASKEKVARAFKIILKDPRVKGILINIFGGIMRCDVIADGILEALREIDLKVPLVVRLEGTNVKEGKAILAQSQLKLITADSFSDAAKEVIAASR